MYTHAGMAVASRPGQPLWVLPVWRHQCAACLLLVVLPLGCNGRYLDGEDVSGWVGWWVRAWVGGLVGWLGGVGGWVKRYLSDDDASLARAHVYIQCAHARPYAQVMTQVSHVQEDCQRPPTGEADDYFRWQVGPSLR